MLKTNSPEKRPKVKKRVRFALDEAQDKISNVPSTFIEKLVRFHKIQTKSMFLSNYGSITLDNGEKSHRHIYRNTIARYEYGSVLDENELKGDLSFTKSSIAISEKRVKKTEGKEKQTNNEKRLVKVGASADADYKGKIIPAEITKSAEQIERERKSQIYPEWHAPWKLKKVISGHNGWVRSVGVDVSNDWFITGSNDRTIKIWDLASGTLKLTLTGHTTAVRGLVVSNRHPYIFSCSDDKTVRCWDFEQNKVIRKYHGHLNGVYGLSLHPTLDVLVSVGRDCSARVWDVRTKAQIFVLSGHKSTVGCVQTQEFNPQIITGSHDQTIRLWDLRNGQTLSVLTHHKKSIRDLVLHFEENTFVSAAADAVKVWKCPEGNFLRNISESETILNTASINRSNVFVTGGDEGSLNFYDYKTGYNFQTIKVPPQPGSLESEAGIFASSFDMTGSRLITCEADKTIKIWKEDENATPENFPINFKPRKQRRVLK